MTSKNPINKRLGLPSFGAEGNGPRLHEKMALSRDYDYYHQNKFPRNIEREETPRNDRSHVVILRPRFDGRVIRENNNVLTIENGRIGMRPYFKQIEKLKKNNNQQNPDQFYLEIGVLNGEKTHKDRLGDSSNDISYAKLMYTLINHGFDPLLPIRHKTNKESMKGYRIKQERKLGAAILKELKKVSPSMMAIKGVMAQIGKEIVHDIRDYIKGGEKPRLERSTIRNRRYYQKQGVPYPKGLEAPLMETGQLARAINYKVCFYNSTSYNTYLKDLAVGGTPGRVPKPKSNVDPRKKKSSRPRGRPRISEAEKMRRVRAKIEEWIKRFGKETTGYEKLIANPAHYSGYEEWFMDRVLNKHKYLTKVQQRKLMQYYGVDKLAFSHIPPGARGRGIVGWTIHNKNWGDQYQPTDYQKSAWELIRTKRRIRDDFMSSFRKKTGLTKVIFALHQKQLYEYAELYRKNVLDRTSDMVKPKPKPKPVIDTKKATEFGLKIASRKLSKKPVINDSFTPPTVAGSMSEAHKLVKEQDSAIARLLQGIGRPE